jgi:hypothetical protein
MQTALNSTARIVSVVFHPLLIPTYAFLISLSQTGHTRLLIPSHAVWMVTGLIFMLTAAIPSVVFYIMLRLKMISSLQMPHRQERNGPIFITALFFYLTYQTLSSYGVAPLYSFYMLAASMLSLLANVINFWYKLSLHMVALGALAGSLTVFAKLNGGQFLLVVLLTVLAAGITGTARLKLRAHSETEIYVGFLTGFIWMYVLFAIIR